MGEREIDNIRNKKRSTFEFCENTKNTHTPIHTPQQQREEEKKNKRELFISAAFVSV